MTTEDVLAIFRETGALLDGHFVYTSGFHGRQFLQASRVLQFPEHTETLCRGIAEKFRGDRVELVVGPATGGIILAYETARHLRCRAAFTEKEDGEMALKRGFLLKPGTRILVVEDITTTGASVRKSIAHLRQRGGLVVGVAALIDRSRGDAQFDCPFHPLATLQLEAWPPDDCPLCSQRAPLIEPDNIQLR